MRINGIPSKVIKTYAVLSIRDYGEEVLLTMEQKRGYISPMIIVNKKELKQALDNLPQPNG